MTDTVALDIGDRVIHGDGKLAYFHLADEGSVWALQGNCGSAGVQGVQGILGPTAHPGSAGKRGNRGSEGPVGKIGKVGLKGPIGPVVAGVKGVAGEWGKNFMRIWGIPGKKLSYYKDIHTFPTSANNPCEIGRWNVACIVFDTKKTQIHHYGSIMERFVISHVILHSTTANFTYSTISNPTTQQVSMATSLVWIFLVTSSQYRKD